MYQYQPEYSQERLAQYHLEAQQNRMAAIVTLPFRVRVAQWLRDIACRLDHARVNEDTSATPHFVSSSF
ncbi:hypothetical protein [Deinococcus hopiensis]|uniref:hypothetical protein n=1 Tax=Deinococcus hopiensis TaxID=309885 RepID=UPI0009FDB6D1|nr:hypothetical protein [Deinococcus hopiensis]